VHSIINLGRHIVYNELNHTKWNWEALDDWQSSHIILSIKVRHDNIHSTQFIGRVVTSILRPMGHAILVFNKAEDFQQGYILKRTTTVRHYCKSLADDKFYSKASV